MKKIKTSLQQAESILQIADHQEDPEREAVLLKYAKARALIAIAESLADISEQLAEITNTLYDTRQEARK